VRSCPSSKFSPRALAHAALPPLHLLGIGNISSGPVASALLKSTAFQDAAGSYGVKNYVRRRPFSLSPSLKYARADASYFAFAFPGRSSAVFRSDNGGWLSRRHRLQRVRNRSEASHVSIKCSSPLQGFCDERKRSQLLIYGLTLCSRSHDVTNGT
jgi:hypothetical protein